MAVTGQQLADAVRVLAMDAVEQAASGHPGLPMGMADAATVLFRRFVKYSAASPDWHDRDRFVLSAGHGSMLLYALLHLSGYDNFSLDALKRFRQLHSPAAGHPEAENTGVETTTGPLGQGLANAVGMALAERLLAAEYGSELCDHRTWVIAGDGCLMEGISHEAASLAGHLRLAKLTVLFDDNHISIDGNTDLSVSDDTIARFSAYGWVTMSCDGHDREAVEMALAAAQASDRPTLIACRTTIGYGAPKKQGTAAAHGSPLGADEAAAARAALGWAHPPFEIPDGIRAAWREIGGRGDADRTQWEERLAAHPRGEEFRRRMDGELPEGWDSAWRQWRLSLANNDSKPLATRAASGETLKQLTPHLPALLGGSADLTGSNNTAVGEQAVTADAPGRYIHYGVREHGMAAAMNGIALHGGFIPYGGTFLVFSDYCRPAIRLSALMGVRVIYVLTHDSIGLGEDGPTHQPVEHLAALRVIPNLRVWRPCDAAETAECWRLAILRSEGPSALSLSRQALPPLSGEYADLCARGAYLLAGGEGERALTIIASGSEVALGAAIREKLAAKGIVAALVSAPCLELFLQQDEDWRRQVLPPTAPMLAIEAAVSMPWRALAAAAGVVAADYLCLESFGVSAPGKEAFEHFGFTVDNGVALARALINDRQ